MRKMLRIAAVVVAVAACSAERSTAGGDVSQEELLAALRSEAPPLVLDVRSPDEYASGRVPGARNLPVGELASRLDELGDTRDREVVVYCERGPRARQAEAILVEAGYTRVRHLEGDMSAWREKRMPCDGC
jgi:rhodanese-related sulfurtransferase